MAGNIFDGVDETTLNAIADGHLFVTEFGTVIPYDDIEIDEQAFFDRDSEYDPDEIQNVASGLQEIWDRERDLHDDDFIEDDPYTFKDHDYNSRSIRIK